jgi:hypothetical protein
VHCATCEDKENGPPFIPWKPRKAAEVRKYSAFFSQYRRRIAGLGRTFGSGIVTKIAVGEAPAELRRLF